MVGALQTTDETCHEIPILSRIRVALILSRRLVQRLGMFTLHFSAQLVCSASRTSDASVSTRLTVGGNRVLLPGSSVFPSCN